MRSNIPPEEICPFCGKKFRFHVLASIRVGCDLYSEHRETRDTAIDLLHESIVQKALQKL
jgi:hypothetical protein